MYDWNGAISIFTDALLVIIPVSVVSKLQLRTKDKMTIMGIFGLRSLSVHLFSCLCAPPNLRLPNSVCITSIVRLVYYAVYFSSPDPNCVAPRPRALPVLIRSARRGQRQCWNRDPVGQWRARDNSSADLQGST